MSHPMTSQADAVLLAGTAGGEAVVEGSTPLRRLNYFDGKFLRADDLRLDQSYLRHLAFLGNQGGGPGVVRGFDVTRGDGDALVVSGGLAFDPQGRVLLLQGAHTLSVRELLELAARGIATPQPLPVASPVWWMGGGAFTQKAASLALPAASLSPAALSAATLAAGALTAVAAATPYAAFAPCEPTSGVPTLSVQQGTALWIVSLAHAEALCGMENVYGKLCEDACVGSMQRPYVLEGVVVRLRPLALGVPLATSSQVVLARRHLRSLVASAWFETERREIGSLISAAGLGSELWCRGAWGTGGVDVPIGVLARAGDETVFLDPWTVRRERMEAPPRRYWAWRMAMRPWDVFLAQVLQFQCQLHELMHEDATGDDPCADQRVALVDTVAYLRDVERDYGRYVNATVAAPHENAFALPGGAERLASLAEQIGLRTGKRPFRSLTRILVNGGIVETPSAGYLPVDPQSSRTVNDQVRALLGEGVDLRFCVVRPDYVPHAFEEAQHMERISLIDGLDHPERKPHVDVLVPDGTIVRTEPPESGLAFDATLLLPLALVVPSVDVMSLTAGTPLSLHGVARPERLAGGGAAIHYVGAFDNLPAGSAALALAAWGTMRSEHDPFVMTAGAATAASAELLVTEPTIKGLFRRWQLWGTLTINQPATPDGSETHVIAHFDGSLLEQTARATATFTESSSEFRATVTLVRGSSSATRYVTVRMDRDARSTGFLSFANWGGSPLSVTAMAGTHQTTGAPSFNATPSGEFVAATTGSVASPVETPIAAMTLREDRTVLGVQHALHARAIASLELIGTALTAHGRNGAAFSDAAQRALFPTAAPAREIVIRATRDWVMFHRRRERECATPTDAPPVAPPRRYRMYHVALASRDLVAALRQGLAGTASLSQFTLQEVDTVTFAAGSPTLTSAADAVRIDWSARNPGKQLVYGAVATPPAVDQVTLASARLRRVVDTLAPVTPFDATTGTLEALVTVPPSLERPGTDGVIVLATFTPTVATTNIAVYRVEPSAADAVEKYFGANDLAHVLSGQQGVAGAKLIDVARFEGQSGGLVSDAAQLRAHWDAAGDCPPARSHLFPITAASDTGNNTLHTMRARLVESVFGPPATTPPQVHPRVATAPPGLPADTAMVDVVVPSFVAYRAYVFVVDGTNEMTRWLELNAKVLTQANFAFNPRWEGFAYFKPGQPAVLELRPGGTPPAPVPPGGMPPASLVVRPLLFVDPAHARAEGATMRVSQVTAMHKAIRLPDPLGLTAAFELPRPTSSTGRTRWPDGVGGVVIFVVQAGP